MDYDSFKSKMNTDGFAIVPSILTTEQIGKLREELDGARSKFLRESPDVFDKGMVHNCMHQGDSLKSILDHPALDNYVGKILGDTYILYAYQSSSLDPADGNYGSRIHVDCPRFIPGYQTNAGVIFPLDDFTEENGATYVLPGSHLSDLVPTEEDFDKNAVRARCNAGDMIIFMGRLWHKAGFNETGLVRHSITLNFCRSYMRQRFDFPRLLSPSLIDSLGEQGKRLVGMNVRMPSSLAEFYLPVDQRLYKPNQG